MKPQAPCKDCRNRTVTCHGVCKKYQAFRTETEAYNRKVYEQRNLDAPPRGMMQRVRQRLLDRKP